MTVMTMKNKAQMKHCYFVKCQMKRSQLAIVNNIESCVRPKIGINLQQKLPLLPQNYDAGEHSQDSGEKKNILLTSMLSSTSNDDIEQFQTDIHCRPICKFIDYRYVL